MRKIIFGLLFMSSVTMFGYSISNRGKQFIKNVETCVLTAYWDSDGYSIGYGHHGKDVKKGMKITKRQADIYFDKDIKGVEESANRLIKNLPYQYKFSQSFFDGLCSLIYNCGENGIRKSNFYNRLKSCRVKNGKMNVNDYNFTMAAIKSCRISCKGHIERRANEYKLMIA